MPTRAAKSAPIPTERFAAPARRALANAGLETLGDLAARTKAEVASLHGIGNNALRTLAELLEEHGLTFTSPPG